MKNQLSFFLKSVLLGTISASVLSALILGLDGAIRHTASAHQLWPDWLTGAVFGGLGGIVVAIIIAAIMVITKKTNLLKLCIGTSAIVGVSIILLLIYFSMNSR